MAAEDETLLEFPCRFPIKAMGRADGNLPQTVEQLVRQHAPELQSEDVRVAPSRKGNYLAVTVTITATSKQQLDAIYLALNGHDAILMTL